MTTAIFLIISLATPSSLIPSTPEKSARALPIHIMAMLGDAPCQIFLENGNLTRKAARSIAKDEDRGSRIESLRAWRFSIFHPRSSIFAKSEASRGFAMIV
jgi:hypothetical protein